MPATNWREITFSRAHLRPNDGYDPQVKILKDQTRALGKTMDLHSYGHALKALKSAEDRKIANEEKLKKDEISRQETERRNLAEALKMRTEMFQQEWAYKRGLVNAHIEKKLHSFEERAQGQRDKLQLSLKKAPMPPVKYSSIVRDDKTIERKLAQAELFELAMRYNKSLAGQTKLEAQKHYETWEQKKQKKVEKLEEKLQGEEKDVRDACDREMMRFEFQYKVALETLQKNQRALHMDVDHAHKNEFGQPREVRKSLSATRMQPKSYKSRQETSSTFYGRLMMEKAGRGSYDVPSVCKMHWGIKDESKFGGEADENKRPHTRA